MHSALLVEYEFLRQQMQNFTICGQRNGTRFVDRRANLVTCNLSGPAAQAKTTMCIDAAYMCARHPNQGSFDRGSARVFGLFDCVLNRGDGFLQIDNDPFAGTTRFGQTMAAISQAVVPNLRDHYAGFRATYIDGRDESPVLITHPYCCPFSIPGLGLFSFAVPLPAGRDEAETVAGFCPVVLPTACFRASFAR